MENTIFKMKFEIKFLVKNVVLVHCYSLHSKLFN